MMADIGNTILLSRQIVEETSLYEGYMLREWQPLFLQNQPIGGDPQEVTLSDRVIVDAVGSSTAPGEHLPVQQTFYGINDIGYQVSLSEPKLMVENETYFPGWTATANISGEEQELQAVQVNGAFRGWFLPAGTYELRAHFEFPYMRLYLGVGASACMIWFVAVTVVAYSQLRCYRWAKGCA